MKKDDNVQTIFGKNSAIRVSTLEIDEAIKQLENAYSEGRISEHELEDRMAFALKAKTEGDLSLLLHDLKLIEQTTPQKLRRLKNSSTAIFSGIEQTGHFVVPKHSRISAVFGGCLIDLRKALFESPKSTIVVSAIFGGIEILVPKGMRVEITSTPIFGGVTKKIRDEDLPEDAPVIHIDAKTIFGGVLIRTKD